MGLRRAIPLLAAGLGIAALLLIRFRPASTLLAETLRSAATAAAVVLACIACGFAACAFARRVIGANGSTRLTDALLIGFPTFGSLVALIAWPGVALDVLVALTSIVIAALGAILVV